MGDFAAVKNCVRLTVGLTADQNRYQWVIPYGSEDDIVGSSDIFADFSQWIVGTIIPTWQAIATADQALVGIQLEDLTAAGGIIPNRVNYGSGTYVGTAVGDSTPAQTSAIICWYNQAQADEAHRLLTAKTFIGPMPEGLCNSGIITNTTALADLEQLALDLQQFVGAVTSLTWRRCVGKSYPTPDARWLADRRTVRTELFTQKRRMQPLF